MFTDNLYEKVLLGPVREGCDELFIVTGYASATFLRKHLRDIRSINPDVTINLIRGMKKLADHSGYLSVVNEFADSFNGYYYKGRPEVHSKTYSWIKDGVPFIGLSGSANYSQNAFLANLQQNQMGIDDPTEIRDYFFRLRSDSQKIQDHIPDESEAIENIPFGASLPPGKGVWIEPMKSVRISILSGIKRLYGQVAPIDSLNWGVRPTRKKQTEAVLNIRGDGQTPGFLPEHGRTFTLLTDDGVTMDCKVYQSGRKAISTTYNNSEIGIYFRNRLKVPSGTLVTKEHLIKYGRTDFVLTKINYDTFALDFSVQ
tara:strand:+ start:2965 stop:3906 length:942 start_codon:yes stop_codon:yes gene_type:complete